MNWISIFWLATLLSVWDIQPVLGDTWITLWNKLSVPVQIHCFREGSKKIRSFKRKLVEPDDRYDIKGKYPKTVRSKFYRHWCEVKAENISLTFDVFGGKNKRINRMSDSYSDWIINTGGIYRFKKGQLSLYYGKHWLGELFDIEDDLAGTPEKELHPEDFVFMQVSQIFQTNRSTDCHSSAPLDINITTANLPIEQQRYVINKSTYASHKFQTGKDMSRYIKAAMKKKFGSFWEAFVEQKESNKTVKQNCVMESMMNFSVNDLHFIVCRVMR